MSDTVIITALSAVTVVLAVCLYCSIQVGRTWRQAYQSLAGDYGAALAIEGLGVGSAGEVEDR